MCPQNQKNIDRHSRELEKNARLNRQSTLSPLPKMNITTAYSQRDHAFVEQRQTIAMRKSPTGTKTPYTESFNKVLKSFHQFIVDSISTTDYYILKNQDDSPWSRTGFNNMRTFCDLNTNTLYLSQGFQQGLVQCCAYQTEQAGVHMIFLNNPVFYKSPIISSSIAPKLNSLSSTSLDKSLLLPPEDDQADIYYRFDCPETVLPSETASMPDKIRAAMEIYRREMALIKKDISYRNSSLCVNLGIFAANHKNTATTSTPHYLAVLSCNGKKETDFANVVLMRIQKNLLEHLEMPTFVICKQDSPVLNFSWQKSHKRPHHEHAESLFALLLNVIDNCNFKQNPDGSLSIHTINPIDGSIVIDEPLSMFDATLNLDNQFATIAGTPPPDLALNQPPRILPNLSAMVKPERIKRPRPLQRRTSLRSSHDGVLSQMKRPLQSMRNKAQLHHHQPGELIKTGLHSNGRKR